MKTDARPHGQTVEEFRATVLTLIGKQLNVPRDRMRSESMLREDLGADSLDMIEIVIQLEEKLGVMIEQEEAVGLETLGDAVAVVERRWRAGVPEGGM